MGTRTSKHLRLWGSATAAAVLITAATPATALADSPEMAALMAKKAKKPAGITPESAAETRAPLQGQAKVYDDEKAATFLHDQGVSTKDPILLLDSADAYVRVAEAQRSIEAAELGKDEARIALDMLRYLKTEQNSKYWQPVASVEIGGAIGRGEDILEGADELITEIEAEIAAANALPPPEPVEQKRKLKPGTGFIAGGAVALTLGAAGLGVGTVGVLRGQEAQDQIDDPNVFGDEFRDWDQRGKDANTMAIAGFAVGGVGLATGIALVVVGVKKRKNAGVEDEKASAMVLPTTNGLVLTGRF